MDKYTSTLSPNNLGANVISLLQGTVCDILNADTQLSKVVSFLPENTKDIDSQVKTALGKQGMVATVMTPDVSYQGRRDDHAYYDFTDAEIDIVENPVVNRASNRKAEDFASAQDTALRAIYVLENSDLGDFNVKGVTSGEYDGLLVTKVTFDAFAKLEPEGPEPEPEWKSGIKLTPKSGVFSTSDVSPLVSVGELNPDYPTTVSVTAVSAIDGSEVTKTLDLTKCVGAGYYVLHMFPFDKATAIYIHDIGQPGSVTISSLLTVVSGRLSHSITKQLSASPLPGKFTGLFSCTYTHGIRFDNFILDAERVTAGCYSGFFGDSTYGGYLYGANSFTVELPTNAPGAMTYFLASKTKCLSGATIEMSIIYKGRSTALVQRGQSYIFSNATNLLDAEVIKKISFYFTDDSYVSLDEATWLKGSKLATYWYTNRAFVLALFGVEDVEAHFPAYAENLPTASCNVSGYGTTYVFDL